MLNICSELVHALILELGPPYNLPDRDHIKNYKIRILQLSVAFEVNNISVSANDRHTGLQPELNWATDFWATDMFFTFLC
jgi:hypothetical protein